MVPQAVHAAVKLDPTTHEFLDALRKGDRRRPACAPDSHDHQDLVYLYTVAREVGLWYAALATPAARVAEFDPIFQQIVATVQFPK